VGSAPARRSSRLSLPPIGAIDQFVDSADVLSYASIARSAVAMFDVRERRGA
jgi:hypothetical protein